MAAGPAPDAAGLWERVRAYVADKPGKRAMISSLSALEFDGARAVLGCPPLALASAQSQARVLGELVAAVLGRPVQVQVRAVEGLAPVAPPSQAAPPVAPVPARPGPGPAPAPGPAPTIDPSLLDHPLVKKAAAVLGGRVTSAVRVGTRPASGVA